MPSLVMQYSELWEEFMDIQTNIHAYTCMYIHTPTYLHTDIYIDIYKQTNSIAPLIGIITMATTACYNIDYYYGYHCLL